MTDISSPGSRLFHRLGVSASFDGERLSVDLDPQPGVLHQGVIRISLLAYLVDVVAAIPIDSDPDLWAFTTDMSVRARPIPAPESVRAVSTTLRQGRRSVTSAARLTDPAGDEVATAAIGFTTVARREGDPRKPEISLERASELVGSDERLALPLREEAGIEVVEPAAGVVEVPVTADLQNPAGTLQGAIVALVAEAAAEDLLSAHHGEPVVVTELDLRYLAQTRAGPVRTSARLLGDHPGAPVEVLLTDVSTGAVTTHAFARGVPVP